MKMHPQLDSLKYVLVNPSSIRLKPSRGIPVILIRIGTF